MKKLLVLATAVVTLQTVQAGTLSPVPLFVSSRTDPNVLFNLSIETPMQGAAFNDQNDTSSGGSCTGRAANEGGYNIGTCYFKTKTYRGYFDSAKCYSYSTADNRFNPVSSPSYTVGSSATCGGTHWSGNFLNWATMTAIDIFRYSVTGGNRHTDTAAVTALQSANQTLSKGHSWFPLKKIGSSVAPGNVDPRTVTPLNKSTIYIYSHGTQIDVGDNTATNASGYTNLYVRPKVCDSAIGLESNCTQYGTSFKPTGLIQNNAERMRFAVTSFMLDNDQRRDGGVLRAKAKHVGPRKYVPGTGAGSGWITNPAREWSDADGTFVANPDTADASASGVTSSGVINYINKFGANGYKSYDPAAELYYESLRYLMGNGRSPTTSYVSNSWDGTGTLAAASAKMDGFPVIRSWDDPYQWTTSDNGTPGTTKYSCQKSFIVGINDANPWLDKRLPGTHFTTSTITQSGGGTLTLLAGDYGTPPGAEASINVTTLTNSVGQMEGLNNTTWSNSGSWTSTGTVSNATGINDSVGGGPGTYNTNCGTGRAVGNLGEIMGTCPYTPKENSYYIAGLAYYGNTQDIRTDISSKQTVATYMIDTQEYSTNPLDGPKNMLWLAGKYGGFIDSNGDSNPNVSSTGTNKTEWDKDGDGIPDNYVFASQPDKLITGLANAFDDIFARTSSASAVATNTGFLSTNSKIYQARFNSGDWSGDLSAYGITAGTGTISTTVDWSSATRINAQSASSRVILTRKLAGGAAQTGGARLGGGIGFAWPTNPASPSASELDVAQTDALRLKPGQVFGSGENCTNAAAKCDAAAVGSARLNYVRGDKSNEGINGYGFRRRLNSVLGDIINSNPTYLGAPADGHLDSAYMQFRQANINRRKMIYVGANDGMLHGIDVSNGDEAFAYIPTTAYTNLSRLTSAGYGTGSLAHAWFVDGTPTIADICTAMSATSGLERNCSASTAWETRLYGGLNGGGRGIFSLDVTDPSATNLTAANADNIVKWEFTSEQDVDLGYTFSQPQVKKIRTGDASYVWAVIFGSGYKGSNGKSVLWILNADTGALIAKLVLSDDSGQSYAQGLATIAATDLDGDGVADTLYAGDMRGNLWKVRQKGGNGANAYDWEVYNRSGGSGVPLFIAQDAAGTPNRQPITAAAAVMSHPKKKGQLVFFGTGKYFEDNDQTTSATQTIYGIWDDETTGQIVSTRGTNYPLQEQTIQWVVASNSRDYRIVSKTAVDWSTKRGWYADLPDSGERVVTKPVIAGGRVMVSTLVPSSDPCNFGGYSWFMELNPETGGELDFSPFDVDRNGAFNSDDLLVAPDQTKHAGAGIKSTVGIVGRPALMGRDANTGPTGGNPVTSKYLSGTSGAVEKVDNRGSSGRVSWRQIFAE